MAKHCLVVMTDPVPGREEEYDAWYSGRHLDDVLALEGFTAAQRFAFVPTAETGGAAGAAPPHRYLAIYEVDEGELDTAVAALGAARAASARAAAAGEEGPMPTSPALAPERAVWWFTAVSDRRTAA